MNMSCPCADVNCVICPTKHNEHFYAVGCNRCAFERMTPEKRAELIFREGGCLVRDWRKRHEEKQQQIEAEKRKRLIEDLNQWKPTPAQEAQMQGTADEDEFFVHEDVDVYSNYFPETAPAKSLERVRLSNSDLVYIKRQTVNSMMTALIRKRNEPLNNIAIIGDSVLGCICAKRIDVIAMNGARPEDVQKALPKYDLRQYKTIAICIGGNSFSSFYSISTFKCSCTGPLFWLCILGNSLSSFKGREAMAPEQVAEKIHELVRYVRLFARVYVFGVITRNSPEQIKSSIKELNVKLREVYQHFYVPVVEISSADVCTDKVHLRKSGACHFVGKVLPRLMNDCS